MQGEDSYLYFLKKEALKPPACLEYIFIEAPFTRQIIFIACFTYIHTYIIDPFGQDHSLASHTTHIVCDNFTCEWWDLQFKVDSDRQIFEKLFMAILFKHSEFLPEIC